MSIWRIPGVLLGVLSILFGLFKEGFHPIGWTTELIWGKNTSGGDGRIPRPIAAVFYVSLGVFVIYMALNGK